MGRSRIGIGLVLFIGLGALVLVSAVGVSLWSAGPLPAGARYEVPSLTGWGKILSCLLLAALGVASVVWRRPVLYAQAILETSPLGSGHWSGSLVDWRLCVKTVVAVEVFATGAVWVVGVCWRPLSTTDTLGVVGSGAILAFVIHLLVLHRRPRIADNGS